MKNICVGSIVKYGTGWYRVKSLFNTHVNLAIIFTNKIVFKKIPFSDITEDSDNFMTNWQKSESYQSM